MCFSKEISLITLILGLFTSYLCYSVKTPEYKIIGLFFAFVILMQGIDYLLWTHQQCDDLNKNISTVGMLLNHLQPVVLFILKNIYLKTSKVDVFVLIVYLMVIIPYSLQFIKNKKCTEKSKNKHLLWKWNGLNDAEITYIIFLFTLVILGNFNKLFSLIIFLSFFTSYFIYNTESVTGNMWCFFAVFAPLFFYILTKTKVE
jgi:hypothetical protein